MPIKPSEAIENARKAAERDITPWVEKIDRILSQPGTFPKIIDCDKLDHYTRLEIVRQYRAVGWDVSLESCQRDGSWFSFKPMACYGNFGDGEVGGK